MAEDPKEDVEMEQDNEIKEEEDEMDDDDKEVLMAIMMMVELLRCVKYVRAVAQLQVV